MRLEPAAAWRVLSPTTLAGDGGVNLRAAPDGSVLASGPNPGETTYTIEARTSLPRVTAVRLEALPDPTLPKGGPGRDPYGNFQLNGFEIDGGRRSSGHQIVRATMPTAARLVRFLRRLWRATLRPRDGGSTRAAGQRLPRQIVSRSRSRSSSLGLPPAKPRPSDCNQLSIRAVVGSR